VAVGWWLLGSAAAAAAAPGRGPRVLPPPVLAVSFDAGDADADVAPVSRTARLVTHGKCAARLCLVPGRRGQGLLVGPGRPAVAYEPGDLPLAAGTLLFWLKPQDWAVGREATNLLFLVSPREGCGYFGLQKVFAMTPDGRATLAAWCSRFPGQRGSSVRFEADGFHEPRWRLAALRWRGRRFWASLDAGPPAELRRPRPLRAGDISGILAFGSPFSGDATVLDDIRLYDRCLSDAQLRRIWQAESVGQPPG
jgi:hypothetical protein